MWLFVFVPFWCLNIPVHHWLDALNTQTSAPFWLATVANNHLEDQAYLGNARSGKRQQMRRCFTCLMSPRSKTEALFSYCCLMITKDKQVWKDNIFSIWICLCLLNTRKQLKNCKDHIRCVPSVTGDGSICFMQYFCKYMIQRQGVFKFVFNL